MNKSQPRQADVLVIGGGIHGLSTAFHLARRGVQVTVLEADYCARHASGVNAGGVRTSVGIYLKSPWRWLPRAMAAVAAYPRKRRRLRPQRPAQVGGNIRGAGRLPAARGTAAGAGFRPRSAGRPAGGVRPRADRRAACARRHLGQGRRLCRAVPDRHGLFAWPRKSSACRCSQRIEQSGTAWRVVTPQAVFSAEHLVVTADAWAGALAEQVGEPVPVHPEGLMLMVTHGVAPFCAPVLGATGRSLSFKQFANGTVVIGGKLMGALDFPARHGEVDMSRLGLSACTVTDLFPHLAHLGVNRVWAGVEAFTVDDLPVIGASRKASNLSYSFGFCGSGFQLEPGTGQRLAQEILGETSAISLDVFAIDRFGQRVAETQDVFIQPASTLTHP